MTLKFDGWPWKTIEHLIYVALSFVQHFIAISEFKLESQSGNAQFGSKSFFVPCDLEIWQMTWKKIGHLFYATSSFVHRFVAIGEFDLELQSVNAQFGSKSTIFLAVWPWNLTDDPENQYGISPNQHQALCIILSSYVNSNWSYGLETPKLGLDPCDLHLWPLTLTFCIDVISVIVNDSWKFNRLCEHSQ